jgi:hypothetical protein
MFIFWLQTVISFQIYRIMEVRLFFLQLSIDKVWCKC